LTNPERHRNIAISTFAEGIAMPVNMDPKKRKKNPEAKPESTAQNQADREKKAFGEETEGDREKALADAEWKNLWDQTEVIDMDKW
jgi:phage gp16-like protein